MVCQVLRWCFATILLNLVASFSFTHPLQNRRVTTSLSTFEEITSLYGEVLQSQPLLTKSITSCVILTMADATTQLLSPPAASPPPASPSSESAPLLPSPSYSPPKSFSFPRLLRFSSFGLLLVAPWNHYYYKFLDSAIPPTPDPLSVTNLAKVLIDQFVQAPFFTVLIFLYLGLVAGDSVETVKTTIATQYKTTIIANWKLWIPATAINIGFVDPDYRVLFLNGVFFFWSIYLSLSIQPQEVE